MKKRCHWHFSGHWAITGYYHVLKAHKEKQREHYRKCMWVSGALIRGGGFLSPFSHWEWTANRPGDISTNNSLHCPGQFPLSSLHNGYFNPSLNDWNQHLSPSVLIHFIEKTMVLGQEFPHLLSGWLLHPSLPFFLLCHSMLPCLV